MTTILLESKYWLLYAVFILGLDSISIMNNIISVLIISSRILMILSLLIDSFSIVLKNLRVLNFMFIYCFFFNKWKINGNDANGRNHKNIDEIKVIL